MHFGVVLALFDGGGDPRLYVCFESFASGDKGIGCKRSRLLGGKEGHVFILGILTPNSNQRRVPHTSRKNGRQPYVIGFDLRAFSYQTTNLKSSSERVSVPPHTRLRKSQ